MLLEAIAEHLGSADLGTGKRPGIETELQPMPAIHDGPFILVLLKARSPAARRPMPTVPIVRIEIADAAVRVINLVTDEARLVDIRRDNSLESISDLTKIIVETWIHHIELL